MTREEVLLAVVDSLAAMAVPYMVSGSFASNAYGVARATQDADFVIQLGRISMVDIVKQLGPNFQLDSQMSFETITGTSKFVIRMLDPRFTIEMFLLSDDPHDRERFSRRRLEIIRQRAVFIATAEDVVVMKLRWSKQGRRSKDLDDARNVIAVQGDRIDWDYVHRWCDVHGTRELLDRLRAGIPPI